MENGRLARAGSSFATESAPSSLKPARCSGLTIELEPPATTTSALSVVIRS